MERIEEDYCYFNKPNLSNNFTTEYVYNFFRGATVKRIHIYSLTYTKLCEYLRFRKKKWFKPLDLFIVEFNLEIIIWLDFDPK